MNKQALAEEILRGFAPLDRASRFLGMRLLEVRPGHIRMSMRVTEDMLNAQQVCHGGLTFSLADTSFGYACNSHNERAFAASCSIEPQGEGPGHRQQSLALSPEQELQIGREAYREILSKARVVRSGPEVEQVRSVGRRR